ncbi:MAG TPA: glucoamylase family protein [Candidatus Eremiobacteraceae bacterium]|nr:glucoamylase family protein [Candidatus Eremiobacteraceae bacterium]
MEDPIRSELFGVERLELHAASLAEAQVIAANVQADHRVANRLRDNGNVLFDTYRAIAAAIREDDAITPAAEWLIDNFYVAQEQIREIRDDLPYSFYRGLPKLAQGPLKGYPRVFGVAWAFVAHTDSRFDAQLYRKFVRAYQAVQPLTIGELWAAAIALRVTLVENLRRLADQIISARDARQEADGIADRLLRVDGLGTDPPIVALRSSDKTRLPTAFVAQLVHRLRDQGEVATVALQQLDKLLAAQETSADEIVLAEHHKQSAMNVSVRNVFTSMRLISAVDWSEIFEDLSLVDAELRAASEFAAMDFPSRNRYRYAIEELARGSKVSELNVARRAIELAKRAQPPPHSTSGSAPNREQEPGYYLVSKGRRSFERSLGYRIPVSKWFVRAGEAAGVFGYVGAIALLVAFFLSLSVLGLLKFGITGWILAFLAFFALASASDLAVALVNRRIAIDSGPTTLPALELREGVPESLRTMVVMPVLLTSLTELENLLKRIEVHFLTEQRGELHFALLSDWNDSKTETAATDDEFLAAASGGIARLNARYGPAPGGARFLLLHRRRIWNESQHMWMGWERKRGKLHELNRLLRGASDTSFLDVSGRPPEVPSGIRYVVTLDADTRLPRGTLRRLIGKMAHPLNRPTLDPKNRRVIEGYAVLQPRITPSFPRAREGSMFNRVFTSPSGLDTYAFAVSDVYQDLFGEGSYLGKGIYDVDAFETALAGRIPESTLLSHDLLEGIFARAGLLSDIEVVEDSPTRYDVAMARQHRWARGDWQLLPWIFGSSVEFGKGVITPLGRWKMLDNLRRTLSAPAAFVALVAGFTLPLAAAVFWVGFVVATFVIPPFLAPIAGIFPRVPGISLRKHWNAVGADFAQASLQIGLTLTLLAHQAWLMGDAITRTLTRLYLTRRRLLEWTDAATLVSRTALGVRGYYRRMAGGVALGVAAGLLVAFAGHAAWPIALPFVTFWILSPAIADLISRPTRAMSEQRPSAADAKVLRLTARRTWRFFETFVSAKDHLLPPDNFQEDPAPVLAHRTSPTNIGLYLLSVIAARDFGWLGTMDAVDRLSATLDTMVGLERFRGHFYNWYGTLDGHPLEPRYLSSVDSGNLAGHLIALKNACAELIRAPIAGAWSFAGIADALEIALAASRALPKERRLQTASLQSVTEELAELSAAVAIPPVDATLPTYVGRADEIVARARTFVDIARALNAEMADASSAELLAQAEALHTVSQSHLRDVETLVPWAKLKQRDPVQPALAPLLGSIPSLEDLPKRCEAAVALLDIRGGDDALVEALGHSAQAARSLIDRLETIADHAKEFFEAMDFGLLFDPVRQLLSVGYRCGEGVLDENCYDLLASEAHLASFVAIAKGDVAARHWNRLGRTVTPINGGAALISWSGSMFEYLMPSLVLRAPVDSLIDQSNRLAVRRQIEYATGLGIPWGMSESAYNARDLEMTYQYSSFGVPGLGLKRGLDDDEVIAPYATALAAMVDSPAAARNFDRIGAAGGVGRYGCYEALDYTPSRVPDGQTVAVVRSYMAHHQGMTLVAIDDVLHDGIMQDRFHAEPMVQATELLLEERAPREILVVHPQHEHVKSSVSVRETLPHMQRRFDSPHQPIPRTHILSNGSYAVMLTSSGSGYSRWRDVAVTRWREDTTCDDWGSFVFVRDVASGEVWSAGYQPSGKEPAAYEAEFLEDRARIVRRDGAIMTTLDVMVSTEDDAEVRRVSISNFGSRAREIELTSYAEVVLASADSDAAHPAFSNLFVETEFIPKIGAIVATRRLRSPDEPQVWAAHLVVVEGDTIGAPQFETNRARFLGRGRGIRSAAAALDGQPLSNTSGAVLDPIFSLRRRLRLAPWSTARVAFWTLVASSREEVLDLADRHQNPAAFDRAVTLAWTQAQVQLFHLGIDADEANLFQRLAGHVLYSNPALRPSQEVLRRTEGGPRALWACGVSGDLPIVLCRIDDVADLGIVRQLIRAHEYWAMKQLAVDLVILNERAPSYAQDLLSALDTTIRASQLRQATEYHSKRGSIFVLRADLISTTTRNALRGAARATLLSRSGSLYEQVGRREDSEPAFLRPRVRRPSGIPNGSLQRPTLEYFNGLGGFSDDGREYVTYFGGSQWTPAPWINVVANPSFGFQVSTEGSGYTWSINSQRNKLSPWSNDPVSDRPGEAFYVRDEDSGMIGSPTALPVRDDSTPYIAHHGQGYSRFEHVFQGISLELLQFVPLRDSVKISRLRIRNQSGRSRRISVTAYVEWILGTSRAGSAPFIATEIDAGTKAMFATNPWNEEFGGRIAFADLSGRQRSWTGDRTEFIGRDGSLDRPAALDRGTPMSNRVGQGLDPCCAMETRVELAADATADVAFFLGDAAAKEEALALIARYRSADLDAILTPVTNFWDEALGAIQVQTPDRAMDVLLNRWLLYQTLACRIWSRAGFYQASGAYGFRDQLQDVMAVCSAKPDVTREHLLRAASRQFAQGDAQHWWHVPSGQGLRTRISDDHVWLPFAVAHYVDVTDDVAVLDEQVPFLEGPELRDDERESYFQPKVGEVSASLYEHCARALDRSLAVGAHGLPLMGTGDWNDGLNRVGIGGKGESVWLAWFLDAAISALAPLAARRGDAKRAAAWRAHAVAMRDALERDGWDGAWYRRGFFDDGTPLGSSSSEECQIDSIAQSWAVISGAGDRTRAAAAMAAVDARLVDRGHQIVRLFSPPFDRTPLDPGYIKAYPPGIRENGGQYTHGALWSVIAFAILGDGDKAAELFSLLNPINHSSSRDAIYCYKVEPYVACADVYEERAHVGRGGWTWYTGSAGWMYRAGIEWVLGIRLHGRSLSIDPRIPKGWPGFSFRLRYRSATYDVAVENPRHVSLGVTSIEVDGRTLEVAGPVILTDDGATHSIRVVLG